MNFSDKVEKLVRQIPKGKVASYGQIAALISSPRAARVVGWTLHQMDSDNTMPWHRVINSKGYITTTCDSHSANLQKSLLEKEGIEVKKKDDLWWIDMKRFQWHS